jgi:hypothetical protein
LWQKPSSSPCSQWEIFKAETPFHFCRKFLYTYKSQIATTAEQICHKQLNEYELIRELESAKQGGKKRKMADAKSAVTSGGVKVNKNWVGQTILSNMNTS